LDITVKSLERQGDQVDTDQLRALKEKVQSAYECQTDVRYAAARGWIDAIIDPAETRKVLIQTLEVATRYASDEPYRLGVFQV
jgi:acetyl-CoA carboxylase carboxyltransferase component